jgi:hypothetical protein
MSKDHKPKIIDRSHRPDQAQAPRSYAPLPPNKPMRSLEELAPIAHKMSENANLMRRFREVIGSEDKQRVSAMMDEVRRVAQSIDSTITHPEGTSMSLVLMKMLGYPREG